MKLTTNVLQIIVVVVIILVSFLLPFLAYSV
jgi:hypothetical protein